MDAPELMRAVVRLAAEVITTAGAVAPTCPQSGSGEPGGGCGPDRELDLLVFPGFLAATAYEHLTQLPRYLRAAQQRHRPASVPTRPGTPRAWPTLSLRCEDAYAELAAAAPPGPLPDFVDDVGWLIEELRVSLFAQSLRTAVSVSEKRVRTAVQRALPGAAVIEPRRRAGKVAGRLGACWIRASCTP